MTITEVRIKPITTTNSKLKAIASITIGDVFVVHDIKLIENQVSGEYFISMPSQKDRDGIFRDIAHPINTETRNYIQSEIMKEYETIMTAREAREQQAI